MADVALGLRSHSGWAALVALAGPRETPTVVARARVDLAGPGIPKQPYHAAENLTFDRARALLRRCERGSAALASKALREAKRDLAREGHRIVGAALLLASGRPLPELAKILDSHALIHTADGEHFRGALRRAAARTGLALREVREKEVWEIASAELRRPDGRLRREINRLGKSLGPPWTADQKLASLAAWIRLASPGE